MGGPDRSVVNVGVRFVVKFPSFVLMFWPYFEQSENQG